MVGVLFSIVCLAALAFYTAQGIVGILPAPEAVEVPSLASVASFARAEMIGVVSLEVSCPSVKESEPSASTQPNLSRFELAPSFTWAELDSAGAVEVISSFPMIRNGASCASKGSKRFQERTTASVPSVSRLGGLPLPLADT